MDSEKNCSNLDEKRSEEAGILDPEAKIIDWEEFQQELARLWSLSSALSNAEEKKESLVQMLNPLMQVRAESLDRTNELEDMKQKLETRKWTMGNLLMKLKNAKEDLQLRKGELSVEARSLLVAAKSHSAALRHLKVSNGCASQFHVAEENILLAGEMGHKHLKEVQKLLRRRHQHMVMQISTIYPLKVLNGRASDVGVNQPCPNGSSSGDGAACPPGASTLNVPGDGAGCPLDASTPNNPCNGSLTILGLLLVVPPLRKSSFFSDKQEIQRTAAALGYVAHFVSLIASYLDVPLRYPIRLGGSRSYVLDPAPSVEPMSADLAYASTAYSSPKPAGFPLFLEGQDTTRFAYAIFLLNKDIEQLLNSVGIQSTGPRRVLANLKELLRCIQSHDYVDQLNVSFPG
ncbi:UV radiation resistance-associated protein [Nymphaea thermarum]|nr:UV radiation resistance-associated protein [Nymphaea thermarum]